MKMFLVSLLLASIQLAQNLETPPITDSLQCTVGQDEKKPNGCDWMLKAYSDASKAFDKATKFNNDANIQRVKWNLLYEKNMELKHRVVKNVDNHRSLETDITDLESRVTEEIGAVKSIGSDIESLMEERSRYNLDGAVDEVTRKYETFKTQIRTLEVLTSKLRWSLVEPNLRGSQLCTLQELFGSAKKPAHVTVTFQGKWEDGSPSEADLIVPDGLKAEEVSGRRVIVAFGTSGLYIGLVDLSKSENLRAAKITTTLWGNNKTQRMYEIVGVENPQYIGKELLNVKVEFKEKIEADKPFVLRMSVQACLK